MGADGEVTLERDGRQYGATFAVSSMGMLTVKTHTETRMLELRDRDTETLAREVLGDIVDAHSPGSASQELNSALNRHA